MHRRDAMKATLAAVATAAVGPSVPEIPDNFPIAEILDPVIGCKECSEANYDMEFFWVQIGSRNPRYHFVMTRKQGD